MKAALARPDLFYAYVGIGPGDQHPHQWKAELWIRARTGEEASHNLSRLIKSGQLVQASRGLYTLPDYAAPSSISWRKLPRERPRCVLPAYRTVLSRTHNPVPTRDLAVDSQQGTAQGNSNLVFM